MFLLNTPIYKFYTLPLDSPATRAQQLTAARISVRCRAGQAGMKVCISQMNNHHATFTLRNRVLFVLHPLLMSIPLSLPPSSTRSKRKVASFSLLCECSTEKQRLSSDFTTPLLRCVYCLHRQVLYASLFIHFSISWFFVLNVWRLALTQATTLTITV